MLARTLATSLSSVMSVSSHAVIEAACDSICVDMLHACLQSRLLQMYVMCVVMTVLILIVTVIHVTAVLMWCTVCHHKSHQHTHHHGSARLCMMLHADQCSLAVIWLGGARVRQCSTLDALYMLLHGARVSL